MIINLVLEHIEDLGFIYAEAARCLTPGGKFFISELHPFRQYVGTKANFQGVDGIVEVGSFIHNISDFVMAGSKNNLELKSLNAYWHQEDAGKPPRIVAFAFEKVVSNLKGTPAPE